MRLTVFNDKYKRAFGKPLAADKVDMGEKVKQFRSILNDEKNDMIPGINICIEILVRSMADG